MHLPSSAVRGRRSIQPRSAWSLPEEYGFHNGEGVQRTRRDRAILLVLRGSLAASLRMFKPVLHRIQGSFTRLQYAHHGRLGVREKNALTHERTRHTHHPDHRTHSVCLAQSSQRLSSKRYGLRHSQAYQSSLAKARARKTSSRV